MVTKKVKSTGRFGSRYGVGIRKRVLKIESKQKQDFSCPSCETGKLKRISRGIFFCRKCGKEFAGGTFFPETLSGGIVKKMVVQKSFLPFAKELLELKEKPLEEEGETKEEKKTSHKVKTNV